MIQASANRIAGLEARNARLLNENAMLRANPPLLRPPSDDALYYWDVDAGRWFERSGPEMRQAMSNEELARFEAALVAAQVGSMPDGPNERVTKPPLGKRRTTPMSVADNQEVQDRVDKVIGDLTAGSVMPKQVDRLGEAVDKAKRDEKLRKAVR
jgi:hypothetical protein